MCVSSVRSSRRLQAVVFGQNDAPWILWHVIYIHLIYWIADWVCICVNSFFQKKNNSKCVDSKDKNLFRDEELEKGSEVSSWKIDSKRSDQIGSIQGQGSDRIDCLVEYLFYDVKFLFLSSFLRASFDSIMFDWGIGLLLCKRIWPYFRYPHLSSMDVRWRSNCKWIRNLQMRMGNDEWCSCWRTVPRCVQDLPELAHWTLFKIHCRAEWSEIVTCATRIPGTLQLKLKDTIK